MIKKYLFLTICILASAVYANAQTAALNKRASGVQVEVNLEGLSSKPAGVSTGGLFMLQDDGAQRRVTSTIVADVDPSDERAFSRFHFDFPPSPSLMEYKANGKYQVILFTPVGNDVVALTIPVTNKLELALKRSALECKDGVTVLATAKVVAFDWRSVESYLSNYQKQPATIAKLNLRIIGEIAGKDYRIKSLRAGAPGEATGRLRICLELEEKLPTEAFAAKIEFLGTDRPADFGPEASATDLPGRYVTVAKKSDLKSPSERNLEQNLDLGITLTSAVNDFVTPATATELVKTIRQRTNRGVLDIRFAPTLNLLRPVIESNKWLNFLTPFYINANIATGKIVKETLSLNRILIGAEGESRYNVRIDTPDNPQTEKDEMAIDYPWTHRLIWGLTNASDRDLKQQELTGKIEYKPIFWALNLPINLNYTVRNNEKVPGLFGYTFKPTIGFEFGRTYSRRNPAEVIKPSPNVRRLYFGIDASLDVTRHLTFSVSDTFYLRGENSKDRQRNYFKAGTEAPLGAVFGSAVHSFFLSFERGDLPPFTTLGVNVFKTGYRIQANYCNKCR